MFSLTSFDGMLAAIDRSREAQARRHPELLPRSLITLAATFVVLTSLLTIGAVAPAQAAGPAAATGSVRLFDALSSLQSDEHLVTAELAVADSEIASAQQVLAASDGKTLDQAARTELTSQVAVATANRAATAVALAKWGTLNLLGDAPESNALRAAQILNSRTPIALSVNLSAIDDVNAAVAAWTADQARQAAEAAAAAAAAAAQPRSRYASLGAPVASGDKQAIAMAVFARYGFSNVVFDGGQSQGHYAATDLDSQTIYMQLSLIPVSRVASVAIHEYQHILQARAYGGYAGTVAHFGSVMAMEEAADCGALAAGATWVDYGCH